MIGDLYIYSNTFSGDTNIIDLSPNNFTINKGGNPYHVTYYTSTTPLINSSIYLSDTSSLSIPTTIDIGTNDFTFDIYYTRILNNSGIVKTLFHLGSFKLHATVQWIGSNYTVRFYLNNTTLIHSLALSSNQNLITITRQNGVFKFFLNGILDSVISNQTSFDFGNDILITLNSNGLYSDINTVRLLNGTSLYNTNFPIPTFPYTDGEITGQVTENNIGVIRTIRLYNRDNGLLTYTTTSNADGSYSIPIFNNDVEYDVVFLDDTPGTIYNDIIKRTSLI